MSVSGAPKSVSVESSPPALVGEVPGPRSRALAARLAAVESRDTTCLAPEPPIFWERAAGSNVWDVDGNRFVDLGGAFAVAAVGHSHPRVVAAIARQAERLLHGMGDVQPPAAKVELLEALVARFPGGGPARAVLGGSGADAVEAALETAWLATGRPGVLAFEGGYHGLSLGTRGLAHRARFREPFMAKLPLRSVFARFGDVEHAERVARSAPDPIGAVIVEPVQGRGGVRVAPPGFLRALRELCDGRGWLLIADEIFTGFGRTGRRFACEHEEVVPDLLCVGKALTSGMPLSACIGRASLMDCWPRSEGEALRTQTFLGHPPACAAALASLALLEEGELAERAAREGAAARSFLVGALDGHRGVREVRGLGLMLGIECTSPEQAERTTAAALARGVILLRCGADGSVLSITPPLTIPRDVLYDALERVVEALDT